MYCLLIAKYVYVNYLIFKVRYLSLIALCKMSDAFLEIKEVFMMFCVSTLLLFYIG